MIAAQVVVHDGITQPLERFGAAAPKMLDLILKTAGYRYRAFLRKNYLSGQMLAQQTGQLAGSIVVGKKKGSAHVFLVGSKKIVSKQDFGGLVIRRSYGDGVKLSNIFEHAGGYTITPKTAKALVFSTPEGLVFTKRVQGRERPFMSASAAAFNWGAAFDSSTEQVIARELKKLGLAAS